ncbi:MAG: carbohydrate kinase family protein [Candidatus Methanospirareceae archaeon]
MGRGKKEDVEVVGLGALNYDVLYAVERIARGGEEVGIIDVKKAPGGSAANTIVGLARLGVRVGFVGIVGKDKEGEIILEDFKKEGVEVHIKREEGYTGAAIGLIDKKGERALYILPGVNDKLSIEDVDLQFLEKAYFIHTSSFVNKKQLEMQTELVKRVKSRISFSPGMLCFKYKLEDMIEIISRSDVIFLSLGELQSLIKKEDYKRGARELLDIGAKIVCVTLGEKGCYVTDGISDFLIEAYPTKVVDTTGAGDAFAAGFLYGLLRGKDIYKSGKIGNFVASCCIREYGCRKGLPYKEEVEEFCREGL